MRILLEAGARTDLKDSEGQTVFDFAYHLYSPADRNAPKDSPATRILREFKVEEE